MDDAITTDAGHQASAGRSPIAFRKRLFVRRKRPSQKDYFTIHCSCKGSTCLNFLCECFEAGFYCMKSCACQICCNRPGNDSIPFPYPPEEDGTFTNPAESSHIRGCSCKNCGCFNPLCVCFMANVGCSDGCGCEGCSNSFGRRAESEQPQVELDIELSEASSEATQGDSDQN